MIFCCQLQWHMRCYLSIRAFVDSSTGAVLLFIKSKGVQMMKLITMAVCGLMLSANMASAEGIYQAIQGTWTTNNSPAGVTKQPTTFIQLRDRHHRDGSFFRVESYDYGTVLGSWDGQVVRATGPFHSDAEGWVYFRLGYRPARMMNYHGRTYILEVDYANRHTTVEAIKPAM